MHAKIKYSRARDRVTQNRKVSINQGDIPSHARDGPAKGTAKGHVPFRVDVNKE